MIRMKTLAGPPSASRGTIGFASEAAAVLPLFGGAGAMAEFVAGRITGPLGLKAGLAAVFGVNAGEGATAAGAFVVAGAAELS